MHSPITLDALRTLDAIDRRRSFSAAAEELCRVPSAVSYTISKLEEDLGVAIFDRSHRKAELTPVGRLILDQGRHILTATEELTALAKQASEGWEVEMKICIDSLLEDGPVLDLVETFQELHPFTEVRLTEEVLGGTWDALIDERCDIVVGAAGDPPAPGYSTYPLGQVRFEFVVAAEHPLTTLPQPLSIDAIHDYPTVVVADSSRRLPVRTTGLLDGRTRIVVPSITNKIRVQTRGLGVGYLPVHRIQQGLKEGSLKTLILEESRPPRSLSIAWRKGSKGKALKWFLRHLRNLEFDTILGLTTRAP